MGALKFRLTPPDLHGRPDLRKTYVTGLDRTPGRGAIDLRPGLLTIQRENPESGRVHVPWEVEGFGRPVVATATLADRPEPYDLAVELARGKLNEVRNQLADWVQIGLTPPAELERAISESSRAFARAATARDEPEAAAEAARASLRAAFAAGRLLTETYTLQVLKTRLAHAPKLPTQLGCVLEGPPKAQPWSSTLLGMVNAARIPCTWSRIAPDEGRRRWDESDAQFQWCRRHKLAPAIGPLIEFRRAALPNWLWLWEGDFDELATQAIDHVRQAVGRYRGKVAVWHVAHRVASSDVLGLSEEEQIRLTARLLQVARQLDPEAQLVVDFDRPWAEWMGSSRFQLGPLHLADSLARADLGLGGIGLEIAPSFEPHGSHVRDLFEFSRLLDLYALVNLPLHVSFAVPSAAGPDERAEPGVRVMADQWPRPPDEDCQREWVAPWVALAVAKPFVRSVTWLQASDADPHLFPHAGLFRPDQSAKPLVAWLESFRRDYLA